MAYQSLNGQGSSDSIEKLSSLKMPEMLGKSFLDLGCNEGFFCGAALAAGASRAVGVDYDELSIENARAFFPGAEFHQSDWHDFFQNNREKFDVVLFASAIHYASDQEAILKNVLESLSDNGLLILECGIGEADDSITNFVRHDRWDGAKFYYTRNHLSNVLRRLGYHSFISYPSVKQAGDAVDRHVFHIRRRKSTFIFNFDQPGNGKTYIGTMLGTAADVRALDDLAKSLIIDSNFAPLSTGVGQDISLFWNRVVELSMQDWAAERIYQFVSSSDADLTYVEGWLPQSVIVIVMRLLSAHDCVGFTISKSVGLLSAKNVTRTHAIRVGQQAWFVGEMERSALDTLQVYTVDGRHSLVAIGWQDLRISSDRYVLFDGGWTSNGVLLHRPDRGDLIGFGLPFVVSFEVTDEILHRLATGVFPDIYVLSDNRAAFKVHHVQQDFVVRGL